MDVRDGLQNCINVKPLKNQRVLIYKDIVIAINEFETKRLAKNKPDQQNKSYTRPYSPP